MQNSRLMLCFVDANGTLHTGDSPCLYTLHPQLCCAWLRKNIIAALVCSTLGSLMTEEAFSTMVTHGKYWGQSPALASLSFLLVARRKGSVWVGAMSAMQSVRHP